MRWFNSTEMVGGFDSGASARQALNRGVAGGFAMYGEVRATASRVLERKLLGMRFEEEIERVDDGISPQSPRCATRVCAREHERAR